MATELVPFVNAQESGRQELSGANALAINVVADIRGCIRRRPGITTFDGAIESVIDADGISALHVSLDGELFAASAAVAPTVYHVSGLAATALGSVDGAGPAVFAETEVLLVVAAGGAPQKIVKGSLAMDPLGGSPPNCSHILAQNLRLVANDSAIDRTKVRYSDQSIGTTDYTGHEDWTVIGGLGPGFITAESRPDPVVAIYENTNEVWAFGSGTLQVFSPDPALVYASSGALEVGCAAPYSVVKRHGDFAWVDDERQVVVSDGRNMKVISQPVGQTISDMATVADAFGYHALLGETDCYVWTFPGDGRTFVYQEGVGWGQWQGWSGTQWTQFAVTAHHLKSGTGENIVGTSDGKIGKLSFSASTDFDTRINAFVQTGFLDRGTSRVKECKQLRVTIRRGHSSSSAVPTGTLQWRDSLGDWESPLEVSFGGSGDYETTVRFYSLGVYRTRQWRFQFDGEVELVLVKVEEDFEVI